MVVIIREHRPVSKLECWSVICAGILIAVAIVVVALLNDIGFLYTLFAPVMIIVIAGTLGWASARAQLEIGSERVVWSGFFSRSHSIAWRDVKRILMPPPGAPGMLAAVAQMHDGSYVSIRALWLPTLSHLNIPRRPDHRRAQQALVAGHIAYLNRMSHDPQR